MKEAVNEMEGVKLIRRHLEECGFDFESMEERERIKKMFDELMPKWDENFRQKITYYGSPGTVLVDVNGEPVCKLDPVKEATDGYWGKIEGHEVPPAVIIKKENGSNVWMSKSEWEAYRALREAAYLWPYRLARKETPYRNFLKLAWVDIKGEKKMIFVHNANLKGYKMNEATPSLLEPIEEIEYDYFERWCTSFDV